MKDNPPKMRVTLVWDDSPGDKSYAIDKVHLLESKLVNDLDLYLVSPSGSFYYPWRLDPLALEEYKAGSVF